VAAINPIEEISTLRICICGGRDYNNIKSFVDFMENDFAHRFNLDNITIIQGGARGADTLAKYWAEIRKVPCEEFKAPWHKFGRKAGMIRNKQMLNSGLDYLVAFEGGAGTNQMIRICEKAGVPVISP